ncbi:uncharacterized protein LOC144743411 [Ciona intestinalis]
MYNHQYNTLIILENAINELIAKQEKFRERDVIVFPSINITTSSQNEFPVVHPQMSKTSLYESGQISDDVFRPTHPTGLTPIPRPDSERIEFGEILEKFQSQGYIGLVGAPGSGKSTCCKRLAKTAGLKCFFMKFMDMNFDERLTLREFIIDRRYNLDDSTKRYAFQWIVHNQSKCVFILDGYDQAKWRMSERPPNASLETPLKVEDLVANLCSGRLLKDACVVLTSRPYSMLTIPAGLRPKVMILLHDFTTEDTKKVFVALCTPNTNQRDNQNEAEKLWGSIMIEAPQLISICRNPLLLQYTVATCLHGPRRLDALTVTQVFNCVIEFLRRSENPKGSDEKFDIRAIIPKLATLAYNATKSSTIAMNHDDLQNANLTMEDVKDLILFVCVSGVEHLFSQRLFIGDYKIYFSHQCLHEYFAAHYICYIMSNDGFQSFIKTVMFSPPGGHNDKWGMVRRFTSGILTRPEENLKIKARYFFTEVESKFRSICNRTRVSKASRTEPDRNFLELLSLLLDIREHNSEDLDDRISALLPRCLDLSNIILTESEAQAFSRVLRYRKHEIEVLRFTRCSLTSQNFHHIRMAIIEMAGKIGELHLNSNNIGNVHEICDVLHKVRKRVVAVCCFSGLAAWRYADDNEINILQQKLNELQNPELLVEVEQGKFIAAQAETSH